MSFQPLRQQQTVTPVVFQDGPVEQTESPQQVPRQRKHAIVDADEWILFSPTKTRSDAVPTADSRWAAEISHRSETDSLDILTRSIHEIGASDGEEDRDITPLYFDTTPTESRQEGHQLLPRHDGFGIFRDGADNILPSTHYSEQALLQGAAQDNSSQGHAARLTAPGGDGNRQSDDVRERIERWRVDHSKLLTEHVERKVRNPNYDNQATVHSERNNDPSQRSLLKGHQDPFSIFLRRFLGQLAGADTEDAASWVHHDSTACIETRTSQTSKAVGIALLDEPSLVPLDTDSWQMRLMRRIARELGSFIYRFAEHPGTFSTYLRMLEIPPYLGSLNTPPPLQSIASAAPTMARTDPHTPQSSQLFFPTLDDHVHADPTSEHRDSNNPDHHPQPVSPSHARGPTYEERLQQEQRYWERDLDTKLVFDFLLSRFSMLLPSSAPVVEDENLSRSPHAPSVATDHDQRPNHIPHSPGFSTRPKMPTTAASALHARRAALIRQQHPLTPAHPPLSGLPRRTLHPSHKRRHTAGPSCASDTTRRSLRTISSRNY